MDNALENLSQSQRIMNAALKCISAKGYANVSLRDIADEAGVVLSQLNYYYKNKEGLFTEVIKMVSQKYLREIEENLKKGKSENEKISYLIQYFQEMLEKKSELFKLLFDLTSMAIWANSLKELLSNLFTDLTNLIQKHILDEASNNGKFKEYSSITLSRMIIGALFGTSIQVILDHEKAGIADSLSAIQALLE